MTEDPAEIAKQVAVARAAAALGRDTPSLLQSTQRCPTHEAAPATAAFLGQGERLARVASALLLVNFGNSIGSGFCIGRGEGTTGKGLTAAHVVRSSDVGMAASSILSRHGSPLNLFHMSNPDAREITVPSSYPNPDLSAPGFTEGKDFAFFRIADYPKCTGNQSCSFNFDCKVNCSHGHCQD
eukprot:m51a1_g14492 hypothetical protein (183) ;mRNA; r:744523-746660